MNTASAQYLSENGCVIQRRQYALSLPRTALSISTTGSVLNIVAVSSRSIAAIIAPEISAVALLSTRSTHKIDHSPRAPLSKGKLWNGSGGLTFGIIAARCGGCRLAAHHCTHPTYDAPIIPTLPVDQGCRASHSIAS